MKQKTYEYVMIGKPSRIPMIEFLNKYGQEGWQLVSYNEGHIFIFMREIL